ncbi:MAG TPA: PilZ domain-containing protein [Terriglobales bacterium]|nr:PilZ domain-containing protein [Terriglobales bacterium]
MTHFPRPHRNRRATRIRLANTIPALVSLDGGEHAQGKLQTLSLNGGLLQLAQALEAGDFVEISFQTEGGAVRGTAEMLPPLQVSARTTLQAFRFVVLEDKDHEAIRSMVDSSVKQDLPSRTS